MSTVLDLSETRDVDFDQTSAASSFCLSICCTPYFMVGQKGNESRGLKIKWDIFVLVRSWNRIVEIPDPFCKNRQRITD